MKKLMIFMLILGLATVAKAQPPLPITYIELSVNGVKDGAGNTTEVEIQACSEVVIDVFGPADYGYSAMVAIIGDFPGVTGGEWGDELGPPYLPLNSGYYYEAAGYPIVYPAAGDQGWAGVQRLEYDDWGFGYVVTAASLTNVPGGKQFELLYHCCGADELGNGEYVTVQLYDTMEWIVRDTIIFHQVPEPMTITLLGLGAVMLRKKR